MTSSRNAERAVQDADLLRLREPVHRYLARHVTDRDEVEDLTQETLARVWEARRRVDRSVAAPYAVATARNLVLSAQRAALVQQRHEHRLHEGAADVWPEEAVLRQEERQAVADALAALDTPDRDLLYGHYAADDNDRAGSRPPGLTSRLARARSRGRVSYLLALRRIELPTRRCRTVLEALSAGDRRRQERVGAAAHLATCSSCAGCAEALVGRRRGLFGLVPAVLLVPLEPLRRARQRAPRASATAAVAVAGAVVTGLLVSTTSADGGVAERGVAAARASAAPATAAPTSPARTSPAPASAASGAPGPAAPAGSVTVGGIVLAPGQWGTGAPLAAAVGASIVASSVPVESVPSDEGFWVGRGTDRLWVQLRTARESAQVVRPGDIVSFTGRVEAAGSPSAPGLEAAEGRGQLLAQGAYASVAAGDLTDPTAVGR